MIGSIITEVKETIDFDDRNTPHTMPLLATIGEQDEIVIPYTPQTLEIADEHSVEILTDCADNHKPLFCLHATWEEAERNCRNAIGSVCKVLKLMELPDGRKTAFLLPGPAGRVTRIVRRNPILRVSVENVSFAPTDDIRSEALLATLKEEYIKIVDTFSDNPADLKEGIANAVEPLMQFFFMIAHSPLNPLEKQRIIDTGNFEEGCTLAVTLMEHKFSLMEIQRSIRQRTHEELSTQQKEHFIRTQIQLMQNELGGSVEDSDDADLRSRAAKKKWPEAAAKYFENEIKKLERFNVQNPEYSIQYNFLDTLLSLPWDNLSKDDFDLNHVEEILNRDHFGLEKVKERILEQVAVLKLRKDMRAPIICLYGPPGVGKTSLGRSIAEALGREYCRVALGGLHDEAEIRGHRRTYIGALPGRIISAMKKCGTGNPLFVLDEIDKIGKDFKGDPSTALLEVLDPEQNVAFHDNYIDIDYDLSRVLFIATANDLSGISRPLLDRMELVEISGYVVEEKIQIALRHLVKRQLREHGFQEDEISFTPEGVQYLIDRHTRESGVRQLEKAIARVLRKIARRKAADQEFPTTVDPSIVEQLLGAPEIIKEQYEDNSVPGVVTGLAWTQSGGEILFIETALSKGKGEKLTLTGNLGDVMKESAVIALKFLKSHADYLGLSPEDFDNNDVHIHVPEGAVPKDGPSAGITMITALASAFTGRLVRERLAMTGEITLRGKITPIGGVKEKLLAAKRAGITDIILCTRNKKDVDEIPASYLEGLNIHYFDRILDALDFALLPKAEVK